MSRRDHRRGGCAEHPPARSGARGASDGPFLAAVAPMVWASPRRGHPTWPLALLTIRVGVGGSPTAPTVTALPVNRVPADHAGTASGVVNARRQPVGALAVATFGALAADRETFLRGLRVGLGIAALPLLATASTSLLVQPTRPRSVASLSRGPARWRLGPRCHRRRPTPTTPARTGPSPGGRRRRAPRSAPRPGRGARRRRRGRAVVRCHVHLPGPSFARRERSAHSAAVTGRWRPRPAGRAQRLPPDGVGSAPTRPNRDSAPPRGNCPYAVCSRCLLARRYEAVRAERRLRRWASSRPASSSSRRTTGSPASWRCQKP